VQVQNYLDEILTLAASAKATEHSYRPELERLFKSIDPGRTVINGLRQIAVGAPDFVFERNAIAIGWCEAKDICKDITRFKTGAYSKEQKARYAKGLLNQDDKL
jgi:hypothetical protein